MSGPRKAPRLDPLLELAATYDAEPATRARALKAAFRFTPGEEETARLEEVFPDVLAAQEDDRTRADLIREAGRLATPGLLEAVDRLGRPAGGRTGDEALRVLARAGIGDAARRVLERVVETGSPEWARALAEVSDFGGLDLSGPAFQPGWSDNPHTEFWLAVAGAKAGDPEPLLPWVDGTREPPPFTWGQPEVAYDLLAGVRPLPDRVLVRILRQVRIEDPTDPDQVAARGNLLVWGLTGIADARGEPPLEEDREPGPALRSEDADEAGASRVAEEVRTLLLDAREPELGGGAMAPSHVGNQIVGRALELPPTDDPSLAREIYDLVGRTPALDPSQLAFLAHRFADLDAVVEAAAEALETEIHAAFLQALGDEASGRGESPFRGAGGGGADPVRGEGGRLSDLMEEPPEEADSASASDRATLADTPLHSGAARHTAESDTAEPAAAPKRRSEPPRMAGADEPIHPSERLTTVTRFPHMGLSGDGPVSPGEELDVEIWADLAPARPGEAVEPMVVEVPEEVESFQVRVTLMASGHLRIVGPAGADLTIDRKVARSETVRFRVAVRDADQLAEVLEEGGAHHAGLIATFSFRSRPSGSVARVVPLDLSTLAHRERPGGPGEEEGAPTTPEALEVDAAAEPADLNVTVAHAPGDPPGRFLCTVTSPHADLELEPEPWHIGEGRDMVSQHLERFIDAEPKRRAAELYGAGYAFFEAAPENFRRYFWHLVDHHPAFESIFVATMDATVPWELMVPTRADPGPEDPENALGVDFDVGRWTSGDVKAPPQRIRLGTGLVAAPTYDEDDLEWAQAEAEQVRSGFGARPVDPASGDTLLESLNREEGGLFHFVGHGYVDGHVQELGLEGDERVGETVLRHWLKRSGFLRRRPTLVFLNACEVGRPQPALVGAGGVSEAFVREGAAAVLAPIWSVKDSVARDVADRFYTALRDSSETPLSRILRSIRSLSYDEGDEVEDSYAAYCFYGDPRARVELG